MIKSLIGKEAEDVAVIFLKNRGYQIIERNWRLKQFGEIDIIAEKNKNFNFVEVKSLTIDSKFFPEQHFTKEKFIKIKKMAEFYANQKDITNWFISLLSIVFYPKIKINYYENVQV